MTHLSKWKVTAYLAAIFFAGVVSGWMGATAVLKRSAITPPLPGEIASTFRERTRKLNLNSDQEKQIDTIADRSAAEMSTVNEENFRRIRQCFSNRHAQVSAILSAEQREQFEKMERERQERFAARGGRSHRRPPPAGEGPSPFSPPRPPEATNGEPH